MKFEMKNLIDNELARYDEELGQQLAEYICKHYEPLSSEQLQGRSRIKRITINVMPDEYEPNDFALDDCTFIEKIMIENNCRDIWVLWTENEDGELEEWWISGDNC